MTVLVRPVTITRSPPLSNLKTPVMKSSEGYLTTTVPSVVNQLY